MDFQRDCRAAASGADSGGGAQVDAGPRPAPQAQQGDVPFMDFDAVGWFEGPSGWCHPHLRQDAAGGAGAERPRWPSCLVGIF